MTTTLGRVPPTLEVVLRNRDRILEVAARHGATSVGVFGSVARGDAIYLEHIRESVLKIRSYVGEHLEGSAKEACYASGMVQDAVLRRLGILSGATGKLSPELKARHPNLKLRQMVDCRNVTSHGYLNVGPNIVWDVIVSYLPEVLAKAKRLAIRGDGVGSEKRTWILHHSRFSRCVVG
jgi:uncharacterized protein with HEPN domain